MATTWRWLGILILFGFLTVFTQVGGLIYLLALAIRFKVRKGWLKLSVFPILYLLCWWLLPLLAARLGRVPLPVRSTVDLPVQPQHWLLVMANRHYVDPRVLDELSVVAQKFAQQYDGLPITYLDANFPFINGFPLLPHRSHDDGEKLDVAFVYQKAGKRTTCAPAFLGYGRFAEPKKGERNQPAKCAAKGYWQYSLLGMLARPFLGKNYELDEEASAYMVRQFAKRKSLRKLFIEPHLKQRWRLTRWNKIRYHGCGAVRHDDHLHIQL